MNLFSKPTEVQSRSQLYPPASNMSARDAEPFLCSIPSYRGVRTVVEFTQFHHPARMILLQFNLPGQILSYPMALDISMAFSG